MPVHVSLFNEQEDLSIDSSSVASVVRLVLKEQGCTTDEVSVYFVSVEEISHLHALHFDDPSPTDCITFPLNQEEQVGERILGEIFICPKVAIDYALSAEKEASTQDFYTELTLYLVHGLLHLLGFDDIDESDRLQMRFEERSMMEKLEAKKILLKPSL